MVQRSRYNPATRFYFVTRDQTAAVLGACPDYEWRLIVAICRFGGFRCPSEVLSLRWGDVDWERGRVRVTSPKTEHHPGKGSREIPLFPELRPFLEEVLDQAPEGTVFAVSRYRAKTSDGWGAVNPRTTFEKIIKRAGLAPWPRLFHALRASRETQLVQDFTVQCVTAWMGNTPSIALKHYLMVTEDQYAKALGGGAQAAQNQAQQCRKSVAMPRKRTPPPKGTNSLTP
jgi:integrase